jgi:uncharacterized protein
MRILYLGLGWLFVGLGIIGVILPVMPTTPFILVAALLFAKGSPRAERWLMEHPLFGKQLSDWRDKGAIARPAKLLATGMMALSFCGMCYFGLMPGWMLAAFGAILAAVAAFILSRPEA